MSDRCPHADTVASFLLGALSPQERSEFEAHLADCSSCASDVLALRVVVDALPSAAPPVPPPTELRERIMSTVRSEAELLQAAGPSADRPRPARRRFSIGLQRPLALAGAGALAVAALGGFGLRALTEDTTVPPVRTATVRTVQAKVDAATAPGGSARVIVRNGVATLVVTGLPTPPRGRVYEVWLVHPGAAAPAPTNALFSVDHQGGGRTALPSVRGVQTVLVTAEPIGGSQAPTQQPFISAPLS